jgi:hypothetical protein
MVQQPRGEACRGNGLRRAGFFVARPTHQHVLTAGSQRVAMQAWRYLARSAGFSCLWPGQQRPLKRSAAAEQPQRQPPPPPPPEQHKMNSMLQALQ